MEIKFKHINLVDEWKQLLIVNPKLVFITLNYAREIALPITITHILRSKAQQLAFYPGKPYKPSVHESWRGIDISLRGVKISLAKEAVEKINQWFPYGKQGIKTALIHDIGLGNHLHLQTRLI